MARSKRQNLAVVDLRLIQLISDYLAEVSSAIEQMADSGIDIPASAADWIELKIPTTGTLKTGATYWKHGQGCAATLSSGPVDFDFGAAGEIDGFDAWRLWKFHEDRKLDYGFESLTQVHQRIQDGLQQRYLLPDSQDQFYVTDSVSVLGTDAATVIAGGCSLPHRNRDSIRTLASQCFESANLMLEHYDAVERTRQQARGLGQNDAVKLRIYLMSWIGYLHATSEGLVDAHVRSTLQIKRPADFQELVPACDQLQSLANRYKPELRKLRNDTFHLRTDNEAIHAFFADDGERLRWARELHQAFKSFFSSYRGLSETHFLRYGRLGESEIRQQSLQRAARRASLQRAT